VAPAAVLAGAPTAVAASKGLATPATGPARAPTTAAVSKEQAAAAVGPARTLRPIVMKGGPVGEWGHVAAVLAGAPAAATAPTACSREVAAA
jgi:hypothetical protein